METPVEIASLMLPAALVAQVEAAAAWEHRPVADVVRAALEKYVAQLRSEHAKPPAKLTPAEAVARMLEHRKGNVLPEGVTIRDLMTYGRD